MDAAKKESVADPTPGHEAMMRRSKLPRVLMEGIEGVKRGKTEWLPPATGEQTIGRGDKKSAYDIRVERTVLRPYYERAVRNVVAGVLGKNVQFGPDVPPQIVSQAENIDLRGNNLTVFMQQVLLDAVGTGETSWITIDMPKVDRDDGTSASGADLKPTDRPFWVHVSSDALLNPEDFEWVNGMPSWRMVRYLREVTRRKGTWGVETIQQVRVLRPPGDGSKWVRWEVYDKIGEEWAEKPSSSGTIRPLTEIPMIRVSMGAIFRELAHLNLSELRKRSDHDATIHKINRPILHRTGVTQKDIDDGPLVLEAGIIFNSPAKPGDTSLAYVEHTGQSLASSETDLDSLAREMEKLALAPHVSRSGDQTATGRAIDFEEAKTETQAIALRTKDAIEEGLRIHAKMLGLGERAGGTVTLPYLALARRVEPEMARLALDAASELGYDEVTIADELKRRGVFTEEMPDPPKPEELPPVPEVGEDDEEQEGAEG